MKNKVLFLSPIDCQDFYFDKPSVSENISPL